MGLPQPPIIIRESRWKAGMLFAIGVLFVMTGVMMVQDPKVVSWKSWLVVLFFGAVTIVALIQLVRPSVLTLDEGGFTVDFTLRTWRVRWNQASNFRVTTMSRGFTRQVSYDYKPDRLAWGGLNRSGQLPPYWTMSPPKLVDLMTTCKDRWGATASPSREPTVAQPLRPQPPGREPTVTRAQPL